MHIDGVKKGEQVIDSLTLLKYFYSPKFQNNILLGIHISL